jgi:hypothetical protein
MTTTPHDSETPREVEPPADMPQARCEDTRPGTRAGTACGKRLRPLATDIQTTDNQDDAHVPN